MLPVERIGGGRKPASTGPHAPPRRALPPRHDAPPVELSPERMAAIWENLRGRVATKKASLAQAMSVVTPVEWREGRFVVRAAAESRAMAGWLMRAEDKRNLERALTAAIGTSAVLVLADTAVELPVQRSEARFVAEPGRPAAPRAAVPEEREDETSPFTPGGEAWQDETAAIAESNDLADAPTDHDLARGDDADGAPPAARLDDDAFERAANEQWLKSKASPPRVRLRELMATNETLRNATDLVSALIKGRVVRLNDEDVEER